MLQVFSLIAMEPPIRVNGAGSADYVRDAKVTIDIYCSSARCCIGSEVVTQGYW